jgi:hypothetical protein
VLQSLRRAGCRGLRFANNAPAETCIVAIVRRIKNFFDCCGQLHLTYIINLNQMITNVLNCYIKQLRHPFLRQPECFVTEEHIHVHLACTGSVDEHMQTTYLVLSVLTPTSVAS